METERRYKVTVEVDTRLTRDQFAAQLLKRVADWGELGNTVYLATEVVEPTFRSILVDNPRKR